MIGKIIDVAQDGRYIHSHRGFLVIKEGQQELGRVPFDQLGGVIASANGMTLSNRVLMRLAEEGIPFVLCDQSHSPVGLLHSTQSTVRQPETLKLQLAQTQKLKNSLWKHIIQSKLTNQAQVLSAQKFNSILVQSLVKKVKSGDPDNIEAQASRRYWRELFGDSFRRNRDNNDQNACLNYGYMVLRAGLARVTMACGVYPGMGLHHANQYNHMPLIDDFIEPFRPFVDLLVARNKMTELTPQVKSQLAGLLATDLKSQAETTTLWRTMEIAIRSYLAVIAREPKSKLIFPTITMLLDHEPA